MPPLAAQAPPRNADDAKERGLRAATLPWPVLDLHEMLDAATETSAAPAAPSAPATDELLSQLAGKEIDRLLSDAGLDPSATVADATAANAASGESPSITDDAATAATTAIATDATAAPAADSTAALINNELDQIVARQLSEAVLGAVDVKHADEPAAEVPATAPEANSDAAGVGDLLNRLDAGERAPAPAPSPEPPAPAQLAPTEAEKKVEPAADASPEEITIPAADPRGPTLTARILDLAAIPLDPFPPGIRDAIGKIAIVTTLNALAVLIYVTFFRK